MGPSRNTSRGVLGRLAALLRRAKPPVPHAPALHAPARRTVTADPLDLAMMQRALALARNAAAIGEVPVGAVVYRSPGHPQAGLILGEGFNRREVDADPSAHAEHIAIVQAAKSLGDWRLNGCSVAVTLEPCPMCAGLIVNARVERVVYAAADPKAGAVRTLWSVCDDARLNHRAAIIDGVLADESAALLREFFTGLRKGRHTSSRQSPDSQISAQKEHEPRARTP